MTTLSSKEKKIKIEVCGLFLYFHHGFLIIINLNTGHFSLLTNINIFKKYKWLAHVVNWSRPCSLDDVCYIFWQSDTTFQDGIGNTVPSSSWWSGTYARRSNNCLRWISFYFFFFFPLSLPWISHQPFQKLNVTCQFIFVSF